MPQIASFLVSTKISNFQNKHVNLSFAIEEQGWGHPEISLGTAEGVTIMGEDMTFLGLWIFLLPSANMFAINLTGT